jgi:long-chain acyl-CoA synthetase
LSENRPEWVVAYFAIAAAGAAIVPLDACLKPCEIDHILQRSGTKLLLASRKCADLAIEAAGHDRVTVVDSDLAGLDVPATVEPTTLRRNDVGPDDMAVLTFTSGTTGVSKGIVLSHRNVVSNATTAASVVKFTCDDRMLSVLPLNHMFEQTVGMLMPMSVGAAVYYVGSRSLRVLFEAMADARPTLMLMVPALARLIQTNIEHGIAALPSLKRGTVRAARRLSRGARRVGVRLGKRLFGRLHRMFGGELRFIIAGGAALEDSVAEFFLDIGLPMVQGYGLTETSPVVSTNTPSNHRVGTVGLAIPQTEVRIDPLAESVNGEVGELLIRGPNVMAGYFEDPDATAAAFDDDGWLRTGDLARIGRNGYITIVGRAKDVIVNEAGKNIYPDEIEAALAESPAIKDACALGVRARDDSTNETVTVLIVPDPDAADPADLGPLLHREVFNACQRLADYKRPKLMAIWPDEQFPRTQTLKIKKHEVRERLGEIDLRPL